MLPITHLGSYTADCPILLGYDRWVRQLTEFPTRRFQRGVVPRGSKGVPATRCLAVPLERLGSITLFTLPVDGYHLTAFWEDLDLIA